MWQLSNRVDMEFCFVDNTNLFLLSVVLYIFIRIHIWAEKKKIVFLKCFPRRFLVLLLKYCRGHIFIFKILCIFCLPNVDLQYNHKDNVNNKVWKANVFTYTVWDFTENFLQHFSISYYLAIFSGITSSTPKVSKHIHTHSLHTHTHPHTAQGARKQPLNYQPLSTPFNTSCFSGNDWIKALIKMHLTHKQQSPFTYRQKANYSKLGLQLRLTKARQYQRFCGWEEAGMSVSLWLLTRAKIWVRT